MLRYFLVDQGRRVTNLPAFKATGCVYYNQGTRIWSLEDARVLGSTTAGLIRFSQGKHIKIKNGPYYYSIVRYKIEITQIQSQGSWMLSAIFCRPTGSVRLPTITNNITLSLFKGNAITVRWVEKLEA